MARVGRTLVAVALVVCLAGWSSPRRLEGGPVRGLAVAGDGLGRRVIAWTTETDVRVAVAERGGAFRGTRTVASGLNKPRGIKVAVNSGGDAILTWFSDTDTGEQPATPRDDIPCCSHVRAALLRRSGRLTAPVVLSPPSRFGYDPRAAVGSRGRFGVLWSSAPGPFAQARFGSFRQGFGPLETIHGRGEIAGLTFDRRSARVQWARFSGELREVVRRGRKGYSLPTTLADHVSYPASFGFDGRGRQVGVWQSASPSGSGARLGTRTPPGPLHQRKLAGDTPYYGFDPKLAVRPSGAAVAAWVDGSGDVPYETSDALVAMRRPDGRFRPTTVTYTSDRIYAITDVAVAPDGAAAVAMWTGTYSSGFETRVVLVGPSGAVRSADAVTSQANTTPPLVEADSRGAVAAWGGGDGTNGRGLWVARSR